MRSTAGKYFPLSCRGELIHGIGLVESWREDHWVEPPRLERLPFSLLYHQTMATLASEGELTPAELARRVLTLSPFRRISPQDYRTLLLHLLDTDQIQRTERGGLIVGFPPESGSPPASSSTRSFRKTKNIPFVLTVRSLARWCSRRPPAKKSPLRRTRVGSRRSRPQASYCLVQTDGGTRSSVFGLCPGDIHTHILEKPVKCFAQTRFIHTSCPMRENDSHRQKPGAAFRHDDNSAY